MANKNFFSNIMMRTSSVMRWNDDDDDV